MVKTNMLRAVQLHMEMIENVIKILSFPCISIDLMDPVALSNSGFHANTITSPIVLLPMLLKEVLLASIQVTGNLALDSLAEGSRSNYY